MNIKGSTYGREHWITCKSHINACHDARHLTSHQDSEQIEALNWPSRGHAHQIYNLQN